MIQAVIEAVIRHKLVVATLVAAGIVLSILAARTAPLDAIPDISDPQIVVYAEWPRSPLLLESEVTAPLVRSLSGSDQIESIRATSYLGYSFIYVILRDASARPAVEQLVTERINALRPELPPDARIRLGPDASSMGWIYEYALVDREQLHDARELRLINENQVIPHLESVPGVAEVASLGGLVKQYQLKLFPPMLTEVGLSLREVVDSLRDAFQQTGGRAIEVSNRDYEIRGIVNGDNVDDVEQLVVGRTADGEAVRIKDVGYIQVGYDQRRGIADLDGKGEVVGGIVVMEQKRNVLQVIRGLDRQLGEIKQGLPAGVEIVTTYDRSEVIWRTLRHFLQTLAYELAVVIAVTALFLRNWRTASGPVAILLLGVLFTTMPLSLFGQTINLFSLAGLFIAIGEMVDATIVIVENCTAELAARGPNIDAAERRAVIVRSMANVVPPLLFSLLIILASFLPVFFLGKQEGRMFDPLAFSKTFAMAFSTLLTVFLLPVIVVWMFKKGARAPRRAELAFTAGYRRAVNKVIAYRYPFFAVSLALVGVAAYGAAHFRKEFMPELEEGSVLYMPTTLPGVPAKEAGWILQAMDKKLSAFPEVASVFGKLGRADTSTDPAPMSMIEATIMLKPETEWRPGMTKAKLVAEMDSAMQIVGYSNSWVQPISARVMMQQTGIQTPVGIKIKGPDVAGIESIGEQIEGLLRSYPNTKSVIAERISSGYFIDVAFSPSKLAEHGLTVREAMPVVRYGISGDNVVQIPQRDGVAIPLNVQYSPEYIDTMDKIRKTPVVGADGRTVTLGEIADVAVRKMPDMVRNDNGDLTGYVYVDIDRTGISATDYVDGARRYLAENLETPPGYFLEWTGDYQYAEHAAAQLRIIVPLTLAIIFVLLLLAFKSVTDTLLIMLSVPFAFVGGIFLQWLLGYPMTTAVIIGYIALFAVAIQTGIIMIIFIRQALARRTEGQSYMDAVLDGSVLRLRPKLMTVAATVVSLLPVMFSTGPGMEIMKPIATPTIGGMLTSAIYVLFLIPSLFAAGQDLRRERAESARG